MILNICVNKWGIVRSKVFGEVTVEFQHKTHE